MKIIQADEYRKLVKKRSKYGNRATKYNGEFFHSAAEAKRYTELLWLEKGGLISGLKRQTRFALEAFGELIGNYVSDFDYWEKGKYVVEDVKGHQTELSRWKIRHFRAQYPSIEFRMVRDE